jgi:hypothetical protein
VSLIGCSGTYTNSVQLNPREPIRVAILPFVQVNSKGEIIKPDPSLLIDDVDLISSDLKQTPAEYVYSLVEKELERSGLDILAPATVEGKLLHNGFGHEDLSFDLQKLYSTNPKELCEKLLGCDAVLYGKVTEWDRSYFAIQSTSSVGLALTLVSARDGKVLFTSTAEDSDSRGLSKGPTGFSDLVIEPIKGLSNDIITALARKVVAKMLAPLAVQNRPEFLNSSAPAIYASAHDKPNGQMTHADSLKVLAFGSADKNASFSIGESVQHIPMAQKGEGHYIGEYFPLPSDSFKNQPVYVFITDEFGRSTQQKLGSTTLSLARTHESR